MPPTLSRATGDRSRNGSGRPTSTASPDWDKEDFPDQEGRSEFESIYQALTATGEMIAEGGSVSTTLFLISDEEADDLARRISALADRYGAR